MHIRFGEKIKYEANEDESKIENIGDVKLTNVNKKFSRISPKPKSSDSHTLEEKINSTLDHISSSRFRSWRLMMRNLPFQTKEQDLHDICKNIGPVTEIVLPKCKDSRFPDSCAGFAFIQFKKRPDAIKALETLNMSEVKGRKIAVDWALPKDTYETAKHEGFFFTLNSNYL
ncbi:unnamed protein product [Gongylonema pulchrum]|uniref:RRM domain-containing protein n=1 Tax=Gongylonema pulchrum TaxID=637853 RepID=A0A183E3U2_9BILA|nr:unnamed protein product [Gongylonema pulchrum]